MTQPIYCLWFNYMWSNVIGPAVAPIIHHLNVKNVSKVDEQVVYKLACEKIDFSRFLR